MSNLVRVVAIVVDTRIATFYMEDGEKIVLLQGDPRLRGILEYAAPLIDQNQVVEIDFSYENSWKNFEDTTNGAVRLFRVAKKFLANLFTKDEVAPTSLGHIPGEGLAGETAPKQDSKAVIDQIKANAEPVSNITFNESGVAPQRTVAEENGYTPNNQAVNGKCAHSDSYDHTIVAVTKSGKIIPGVEQIKSQFANAAKSGSTKGLEIFLERIGKVIEKRKHTVEDLLRFMERGDLPIADDGTIVIYKKLRSTSEEGIFVDVHSGNVKQKVGSYVHMDPSLVDPNRRNECSNGLHVARRGYIKRFSGDILVLAKVAPEDVIAVPDYDANKMRVCGYHIIAQLDATQFRAINANQSLANAENGVNLVTDAIRGKHIGITQHVKIGGHKGTKLEITDLEETPKQVKKAAIKEMKRQAEPVVEAKPLDSEKGEQDTPVNPMDVLAKSKDPSKTLVEEKKVYTQAETVQALWTKALTGDRDAAKQLLAIKKKAKKSWKVLGLPENASDTLKPLIDQSVSH